MGDMQSTIASYCPLEANQQGLLEHNAKVYCCSRNAEKTMPALDRLKSVTGKDNIHFIRLDLADLPSCAQAAKELRAKEPKIDLLFLNAYAFLSIVLTIVESWFLQWEVKLLKDTICNGYKVSTAVELTLGNKCRRTFCIHQVYSTICTGLCQNQRTKRYSHCIHIKQWPQFFTKRPHRFQRSQPPQCLKLDQIRAVKSCTFPPLVNLIAG